MFEVKCAQLDLQKIKHKMKSIHLILLFLGMLLVSTDLSAQDKLDKLSDKIDKLAEQMATQQIETNKQFAELAKQQAITATKVDGMDKRIDTQSNLMMCMIAFIAALVGAIIWDRRAANSPLETKTKDLKLENEVLTKEINLLKERETKSENLLKKLLEKFPDLAGLA